MILYFLQNTSNRFNPHIQANPSNYNPYAAASASWQQQKQLLSNNVQNYATSFAAKTQVGFR